MITISVKNFIFTGVFFFISSCLGYGYSPDEDLNQYLASEILNLMPQSDAPVDVQVILDQTPTLKNPEIQDLKILPGNQRFTATLVAGKNTASISGKILKTIEVPVLNIGLNREDIIAPENVILEKIPAQQLNRSMVTDINNLIGKSAKTTLSPNKPIMIHHIQNPVLVKKGSMVNVLVSAPNMELKTQGRSMDNGSQGDQIRVMNINTKNIIQGTIMGPGQVTVDIANTTNVGAAS
jgi:flagella basal body P-ring formation protein FlgA